MMMKMIVYILTAPNNWRKNDKQRTMHAGYRKNWFNIPLNNHCLWNFISVGISIFIIGNTFYNCSI